jgi:hypothetical protein
MFVSVESSKSILDKKNSKNNKEQSYNKKVFFWVLFGFHFVSDSQIQMRKKESEDRDAKELSHRLSAATKDRLARKTN